MEEELKEILSRFPSYPEVFGLDLAKPEGRFKWFLASMLFAKRISSKIAVKTFTKFVKEGLTTPGRILEAGWDKLVEALDSGGYVRYDYSTATNLLEAAKRLKERYGESLERLYEGAGGPKELEELLREFKGVGPVAASIFLRELRGVWAKARPKLSTGAVEAGRRLKLGRREIEKFEGKLVRLNLEFCKERKCGECPFRNFCKEPAAKLQVGSLKASKAL
ncbi:TPA: hypothetical protein EYP26_02210 [Candidatus Bathyarchaeota archaeon]|nr:hypothetical protein [Candidatus Bathyarchaeota archaeon]